jgi:hypothetical protein
MDEPGIGEPDISEPDTPPFAGSIAVSSWKVVRASAQSTFGNVNPA